MRLPGRTAGILQRLRDTLQLPIQCIVLRGKCSLFLGSDAFRLAEGIGKFRDLPFKFRLRDLSGMLFLLARLIRLSKPRLEFHFRIEQPGALLCGGTVGLLMGGLRLLESALEFIPRLGEREIFLV